MTDTELRQLPEEMAPHFAAALAATDAKRAKLTELIRAKAAAFRSSAELLERLADEVGATPVELCEVMARGLFPGKAAEPAAEVVRPPRQRLFGVGSNGTHYAFRIADGPQQMRIDDARQEAARTAALGKFEWISLDLQTVAE